MEAERIGLAKAASEALQLLSFIEENTTWNETEHATLLRNGISIVRERIQLSLASESPCAHCVERSAYITKLETALLSSFHTIGE